MEKSLKKKIPEEVLKDFPKETETIYETSEIFFTDTPESNFKVRRVSVSGCKFLVKISDSQSGVRDYA